MVLLAINRVIVFMHRMLVGADHFTHQLGFPLFFFSAILVSGSVRGASDLSDLLSLDLEQLAQVKTTVPAALTKLADTETPASITTITAEDIRVTPARNIYDLVEIYVPGASWMNYEEGPRIGLRGIIGNQNDKFLLLINGRLMNNRGHYGAVTELEQWDMNDIERIDVMSGSGSVTYGPGAIGGIINIVTKDADSHKGTEFNVSYVNRYGSKGINISHGHKAENYKLYVHGGVTRTEGYKNTRHFIVNGNNEAGFIGKDIELGSQALDYFADYQDDPQLKFHVDIDFLNDWSLWARYSQQGSTWSGNEAKTDFGGTLENQQSVRNRQWTIALENKHKYSDDILINSLFSVRSEDVERRIGKQRFPDADHVLNKRIDFSEDQIFVKSILNWQVTEQFELAIGGEYSWDKFGPGWNDSEKNMRLGEGGVIVSGPDSNAILAGNKGSADKNGDQLYVGDGWETDTYALLTEGNYEINDKLKVLVSGRMDKTTFVDWEFSPRVALITTPKKGQSFKLVAQKSVRLATAGQLYMEDKTGRDHSTEKLKSLEAIYTAHIKHRSTVNITAFKNHIDVISWDGSQNISQNAGTLKLWGAEASINRTWDSGIKLGANYSYINQQDWNLESGVTRSGVSYSDYNQTLDTTVQQGYGNDLNNWYNQAFKVFGNFPLNDKLFLHIDARVMWDYQGAKDGLSALNLAVAGTADEVATGASIDRVYDEDAHDYDFRTNLSLSYQYSDSLSFQLFALNLLGSDRNKRYSFDNGGNDVEPRTVRFIEEPEVFGVNVRYEM